MIPTARRQRIYARWPELIQILPSLIPSSFPAPFQFPPCSFLSTPIPFLSFSVHPSIDPGSHKQSHESTLSHGNGIAFAAASTFTPPEAHMQLHYVHEYIDGLSAFIGLSIPNLCRTSTVPCSNMSHLPRLSARHNSKLCISI